MVRLGLPLNLVLVTLVTVSMQLFNRVYKTSKQVIDEEFHLQQGLHYCRGNFTIWDPKITTFPGLYIISTVLFMPLKACSVYNLRLTSLIASVINAILIYKIREHVNKEAKIVLYQWVLALETLTISLLPPLYFFSHLYYTDVLSMTFVLALIYFRLKQHFLVSSLFGSGAVLMRQTNIVWVGVVFLHAALSHIASRRRKKVPQVLKYEDIWLTGLGLLEDLLKRPKRVIMDAKFVLLNLWGYLLVLLGFVAFVLSNGSIVVGDKSAHEANLHLVQICYFSLFAAFFGLQSTLSNLKPALGRIVTSWKVAGTILVLLVLVVHFNTVVHPYLLADNRHYTFYVWNRFYGRHPLAKYLIVPAYVVSLALVQQQLQKMSATLSVPFVAGLFVTIALQRLIEVRYFLVPFLFLRLFSKDARDRNYFLLLGLECLFYVAVNAASFHVFFTKEIRWNDYEEIQRIIW